MSDEGIYIVFDVSEGMVVNLFSDSDAAFEWRDDPSRAGDTVYGPYDVYDSIEEFEGDVA